jgi:hypothetical protein
MFLGSQSPLGYLMRTAAGLEVLGSDVEGVPGGAGVPGVGERRVVRVGVLVEQGVVLRPGIAGVFALSARSRLGTALRERGGTHDAGSGQRRGSPDFSFPTGTQPLPYPMLLQETVGHCRY